MANIKSAAKRAKTSEKSRQRNVQTKGEIKTLRKNLLVAVAEPAAPQTQDAFRTAIRKNSRAGALLRKAAAAK